MQKIRETGIRAVCLEPRPHPDFAGPGWFRDVRIVLDEAEKLGMRVWLFDDAHFPTGYANGAIVREYPHLRKKFLKIGQVDYCGPQREGKLLVGWQTNGDREKIMQVGQTSGQAAAFKASLKDEIIGVVAARTVDFHTVDPDTLIDLTDRLEDGVVSWDIPAGNWRVFTLIETYSGGERSTEGYLNPLDEEATQVLIETVYEPHFRELGAEFGKSIAGFFSDEPRFGNTKGPDASIGRMEMPLPWRSDLPELLTEAGVENIRLLLPLLVADGGEVAHQIRYRYMDLITRLYAKNFTGKLGDWCAAHGVEYVGHLIEDNNAHARLGYGAGHFARGISGQTMAGIDVVLQQLIPGMDGGYFRTFTQTGWDGEFFHYGLAKMGASIGQLDPKKKGRTLCELFGAFGYSEGLKYMKWLADHMLVRGINQFVPHAFDMAPFPDPDCPPHFYAHGHDPEFRHMGQLMNYMNRTAELLSDGRHIATAAILYHAEAEWSGDYMLFQKPAKILTQHQIDFDVVPIDLLLNATEAEGKLVIHDETFDVLLIPYAEALPAKLLEKLQHLQVPTIFLEDQPTRTSEGAAWSLEAEVWPLAELASMMKKRGFFDIQTADFEPWLRSYHYLHADGEVYMFVNEAVDLPITTEITLGNKGWLYQYEPFSNQLFEYGEIVAEARQSLELACGEEKIWLLLPERIHAAEVKKKPARKELLVLDWQISLANAFEYPVFRELPTARLGNWDTEAVSADFSGTFRYEADFNVRNNSRHMLELTEVYEVAQVFVNGVDCGVRICEPYRFDITLALKIGSNHLAIEVTNTLGTEQKDFLSQYRPIEPSGLLGNVCMCYE
ncbi:glycosylhydrolase-like jelly roll fold domain-containing protein [Listeria costaricensis]|uniref:glycosylhydrolase-like jelly roll fold domain-containing protein n=1 Tax=Listeria costaricensis TaxID=2026604 RepID=UPI001F09D3DC|nr:glycosylhydrolase-like jelly roll fold domain-containing protein [Listeria costaricensis]